MPRWQGEATTAWRSSDERHSYAGEGLPWLVPVCGMWREPCGAQPIVVIEFQPESSDLCSSMDSRSSHDAGAGGHTADPVVYSRVGTTINGKYRLERVLGVGGMAAVYVATHRNRKQFAIKVLHPEFSMRDDIRKRFLREGYVANTVGHGGAVVVLDDDIAEDGSAFLVMELLEGMTLEALWTERERELPIPMALALAHQLLDVLSAAHSQGVLHRDIKPANLFLTRDRVLKVLDFGIARLREPDPVATATASGTTLGTPAFMPPEQAFGRTEEVDARSDVWAVGATLFALISGEVVHEGNNSQQLIIHAATRPARPFASVAPGAHSAVAELIDRALAFDKADRWQSASMMRTALRQAHLAAFGCDVSDHWLSLESSNAVSAAPPSAVESSRKDAQAARPGPPVSALPPASPVAAAAASPVDASPSAPPHPAGAPARAEGSAPLAAAHIEVNISSSQVSATVVRQVWLALVALLVLLGVVLSTMLQRAPAPAVPAAPALAPPAAASTVKEPPPPFPATPSVQGTSPPVSAPAAPSPAVRQVAQPRELPPQVQRRAPQAAPRPPAQAECARLLELQSLGEALNAEQRVFLRQRCKG